MKHKEDYLYFNTKNLISDLNIKSDLMNHYYGILVEEEKNMKTLQASLYFEIKKTNMKATVKELENLIITDPRWLQQKSKNINADKLYLQAKTDYYNKNTEITLLQSELKRELQLQGRDK